jgi:uncharacterized protein involved in exopolysaccharide biosynthesis
VSSMLKRRSRSRRSGPPPWRLVLSGPSPDELIAVLRAWRVWFLAGLAGALVATLLYVLLPPPFRARATVNVDFHLEQAWPQNTDREQFYYLERETRKLMEIAFADETLTAVTDNLPPYTLSDLRSGVLTLTQPGSGAWHLYAEAPDPAQAAALASAWARSFVDQAERQLKTGAAGGLEPFITLAASQTEDLNPGRTQSLGLWVGVGAGMALAVAALLLLFVRIRS